jgi:hypothetical protein
LLWFGTQAMFLVCRDRQQAGSYDHVRCSGFYTNQISRHREDPLIGGCSRSKANSESKNIAARARSAA